MEINQALKAKFDEHVGHHVEKYPATCNEITMACNNLMEFTSEEKALFSKNLPHGTYANEGEVRKAISL